MKPIQVLILILAMGVVFVKKRLPSDKFIMLAGVTYIWMILFNSYATRYVYFTGFFLVALGLTMFYSRMDDDKDGSIFLKGNPGS
jgi:hypothetical protein